jgi:hypothetical protein
MHLKSLYPVSFGWNEKCQTDPIHLPLLPTLFPLGSQELTIHFQLWVFTQLPLSLLG